jgi:hypothetical protein
MKHKSRVTTQSNFQDSEVFWDVTPRSLVTERRDRVGNTPNCILDIRGLYLGPRAGYPH